MIFNFSVPPYFDGIFPHRRVEKICHVKKHPVFQGFFRIEPVEKPVDSVEKYKLKRLHFLTFCKNYVHCFTIKAGGQLSAGCVYFIRFSRVEALKEVRKIRCIPYSSVSI